MKPAQRKKTAPVWMMVLYGLIMVVSLWNCCSSFYSMWNASSLGPIIVGLVSVLLLICQGLIGASFFLPGMRKKTVWKTAILTVLLGGPVDNLFLILMNGEGNWYGLLFDWAPTFHIYLSFSAISSAIALFMYCLFLSIWYPRMPWWKWVLLLLCSGLGNDLFFVVFHHVYYYTHVVPFWFMSFVLWGTAYLLLHSEKQGALKRAERKAQKELAALERQAYAEQLAAEKLQQETQFAKDSSYQQNMQLLKELSQLHQDGILTDEEFQKKKEELLRAI